LEHPSLLIMDEPTSGLDSFHSLELMATVHKLCQQGLTTTVTIHSPSPAIFSLFEELIVLLDGRLVYCGGATSIEDYKVHSKHGNELVEFYHIYIPKYAESIEYYTY